METAKFKFHVLQTSTVVGAFFMVFPIGIQWFWGNLSIYVLSFYQSRGKKNLEGRSSWVTALLLLFRGVFFIISGYSARFLGSKSTILIGIIIFNSGIMCSYFALFTSPELLDFTLGILCGIGAGFVYGPSIEYGIQWAGESNVGRIVSFIQSGYTCGAVLVNQFITMYLNPHNAKPQAGDNFKFRFFSQASTLRKIPSTLLIIGLFSLVIQILGLCLVRKRNKDDKGESKRLTERNGQIEVTDSSGDRPVGSSDPKTCCSDFTPKEMFQTLTFYILGLTYLLTDYAYLIVITYYKAFGQLWIRDDHFLTCIGTSMATFNIPARMMGGILTDKIGVKNTLVTGISLASVSCAFMCVVPKVNKWIYLITVTLLASTAGGIGSVFKISAVVFFGRKYSVMNIGWLSLISLICMVIAPPVMEILVSTGKWFSLFFSGAGAALFTLVVIVVFLPNL